MTEATAAAANTETKKFPFSPIFVATVTPGTISKSTTRKGDAYVSMKESTVQKGDNEPFTRTVLAFGDQLAEVESLLIEGQPVDLAVQHTAGTMKIIGLPRDKAEAANG